MLPPSSGPSYTRPITACRPQALKLAKQARCSLLTAQDQSIRGHVCSDILAGQRAKETGRVPELCLGHCPKGTFTLPNRERSSGQRYSVRLLSLLGNMKRDGKYLVLAILVDRPCLHLVSQCERGALSTALSLSLSPQHHQIVIFAANAGYFYDHVSRPSTRNGPVPAHWRESPDISALLKIPICCLGPNTAAYRRPQPPIRSTTPLRRVQLCIRVQVQRQSQAKIGMDSGSTFTATATLSPASPDEVGVYSTQSS